METDLKKILEKPPGEYRSAPFWGWNARLEPEELSFQIHEMRAKGMGGCFLHSREGLETPYLSEEWMDAVHCSIEKAEQEGMEIWIYDEDKWPSGSAGGLVSKKNPGEFSAKALTLEILPLAEAAAKEPELSVGTERFDGKILGVYTAHIDGEKLRGLTQGIAVREGEDASVLVLRREISGTSEWYNGYAPTDNLNPKAVKAFLDLTYEEYWRRFQKQFGRTVKGFFTDEPNVCDFFSCFTGGRPWLTFTDGLPEYFERQRGYDPLPGLPYLFFDGEGAEQIRHDYWRTVTELFENAYMKQLYEWCEQHNVELTGHMLYENDLGYQARVCGAAMPQYKYLHRPGIDLLGEQTKEYLTVKQCTSVAHQYGRKHTITETYGCTGWEFGFEGQKWLGDWQFVQGIDRRCQHLAEYSITGCRKRDYPPVFNYQNTWWEYNEKMEDYFARLSYVAGLGEVVREVLVIHPMSSIWTKCKSSPVEDLNRVEMNMGWLDEHITELNRWGETYNRMAKLLLSNHVDFDFGDEMLLAEDGRAEQGRLILKNASYRIVFVPRVVSLFSTTRKLLEEFASQGGEIVWVGAFPKLEEGSCEKGSTANWEKIPGIQRAASYEEGAEILKEKMKFPIKVTGENGLEDGAVLTMLRRTREGYLLLAVNNDRGRAHSTMIHFPEKGRVMEYRPWSNTFEETVAEIDGNDGGIHFLAEFSPAQSGVWFLETEKEPDLGSAGFPYEHPHYAEPVFAALGPCAKVHRTMENALTLDRCAYALGNDAYGAEMEVWKAQKEIREQLSMQQIYYNGAPQRYSWLKQEDGNLKKGIPFGLCFTFEVREAIESCCYAVIEKSEHFRVFLDKEELKYTGGFFIDHGMEKWEIERLAPGIHKLIITGNYTEELELEDCYLIGDFAVDTQRRICKERDRIHFGDWTSQGYFHYPGSLVYEFSLPPKEQDQKRYVLKLGEHRATLVSVTVNGKMAGILMGNTEKKLEITDYLENETNTLELCVVGSPRNLFGPFHQSYTGCSRISWADFRTEGRFYTQEYVLEPYGLFGQIYITMM